MSQVSVLDNSSSDLKSGLLAEHRLSALANIIPCSNPLAGCIGVSDAYRSLVRQSEGWGVGEAGWECMEKYQAGRQQGWGCPGPALPLPHLMCCVR